MDKLARILEGWERSLLEPSGAPGSLAKDGCPISRSFFARCGIPLFFPSDFRFI